MRLKRESKLMVEPPSVATGDIAFNLIVFFLVCASSKPDTGRRQSLPKADQQQKVEEKKDGLQVTITRDTVLLNGDVIKPVEKLGPLLAQKMKSRPREEDRIVVVKSSQDAQWQHWISVNSQIGDAGGIVTLEIEEEQVIVQ